MEIIANAKINLCLDVVKRREDGYHEMDMIMVPINLHDVLNIEIAKTDALLCTHETMPMDDSNTMWKALHLMRDTFHFQERFKLYIEKNIPMEAGMAGGSADAAAVMRGIWKLLSLPCSLSELAQLGKKIGADVPFCIMNTCSLVQGIGEKINPFQSQLKFYVLLVKPSDGVATKEAFQRLDFTTCIHPNTLACQKALLAGDAQQFYNASGNTLEQSAICMVPAIQTIKNELFDLGFPFVLMSGSGSTVFALSQTLDLLEKGYVEMKKRYPFVVMSETI